VRRDQRFDWSMTGRACLTSPVSVIATTGNNVIRKRL
jgi:hypothetical protein